MDENQIPISESVNGFNVFSTEIRGKIDALVKQILLVSGGVLTITISAFLTGETPYFSETTTSLLKSGWLQLSISIILVLVFMLLQVIMLVIVGTKFKGKIESARPGVEVMTAWMPFRVVCWVVGLVAFTLCVSGVFTMSKAAISLIG